MMVSNRYFSPSPCKLIHLVSYKMKNSTCHPTIQEGCLIFTPLLWEICIHVPSWLVESTLNVALRDARHLETILYSWCIVHTKPLFAWKKSTSSKMTWRVQEVAEMFHKFISNGRCIGTTTSTSSGKIPRWNKHRCWRLRGKGSSLARERWGWMFYLSTIKGIDLYGILALEKLIYFLGGLVASGGLHAIYI